MAETTPEIHRAFHDKYRPRTFKQIVGQEAVLARLRGAVKENKVPHAIMFLGPSSAGKTTMARCLAAVVNKAQVEGHPDYLEMNAADARGIDDVRSVIEIGRMSPQIGKRRFIVIDEAQQLTGAAAQAILKPLEHPPAKTTYILCSMDPEKFNTGTGKAISNRCSQFVLSPYTRENIAEQVKHIAEQEEMGYVTDAVVEAIVDNSAGTMRNACNMLESLSQYVGSLAEVPKKIDPASIGEILSTPETKDEDVAIKVLAGVYSGSTKLMLKSVLEATDAFGLINKMLWINSFILNTAVLDGQRHAKVWPSRANIEGSKMFKAVCEKKTIAPNVQISILAATQSALVGLRMQAAGFLVPESNLIGARLYNLMRELRQSA